MAYYASLTSLKHTIDHITYLTQISTLPEFPLIRGLYKAVKSLRKYFDSAEINGNKNILERVCRRFFTRRNNTCYEVNFSHDQFITLNEELREAVCKLEDVLESHVSSILLSRRPNLRSDDDTIDNANPLNFSMDFEEVEKMILSFIGLVTKIKKEYSEIIRHSAPEQAHVADSSTANNFFTETNSSELVGLRKELEFLKSRVISDDRALRFLTIFGMAGIGKTTLAKAFCKDSDVWHHFDYHLYVPIGPNYQLKNALVCILSQLNRGSEYINFMTMQANINENEVKKRVTKLLKQKRYIILLDDVWSTKVLNDLEKILPDVSNGSLVLETTRISPFPYLSDFPIRNMHKKRFLNEEESWCLLCKKVFDEDPCPYELRKLGKKIAEKCEGLPLAIISVGNHLAKAEKTVEYWEYIVEKGITSIIGADDGLLKKLHPSYTHLAEYAKALFLYLGVFPEYCEIFTSKLVKLWTAEGILEPKTNENSARHVQLCLVDFDVNSVIIVKQMRSFEGYVKTCQLHIVYWTYCKIQAANQNLFRILRTCDDCYGEGMDKQHRLCIHNNSLFGIKDSHNAMASVSNVHSLLCTGLYHKHPVPFCFGLKLLRVLEAVTMRFYEFPLEVLNLVMLRYMAFTYDGDLPPSIPQLSNLWYLIVRRHHRIISQRCPSYLPKEIWKMKELRHLQVVGSDLQEPPCGELLPNLLKLLDVTPQSCTNQVLERVPNLKKLGVQIVLPRDNTEPLRSLDYLRNLDGLLSLQCTVVNPKPSSRVAAQAYPTSIFPKFLQKLSLSGFGYSWDQMSEISAMRNLQMLKLRHCAFQGPRWMIGEDEFDSLRFLLLEDIDLQYLNTGRENHWLERAIVKHCYKLKRFPWRCVAFAVEIVDCQPCLAPTLEECRHRITSIVYSWEDRKNVRS